MLETAADNRDRARQLLELHWRPEGFTMPNAATYPWQWLWDSCFHAIVWSELGDERSLIEIERLFTYQSDSGFVPHMNYLSDPQAARPIWGRTGSSNITQPPMYGHAISELAKRDMVTTEATLQAAERGLRFLLDRRRRHQSGLIELCHPWESGCDDSARWDSALGQAWDRDLWRERKWDLVNSVQVDESGGAIANDDFAVASIGFNALVAFNARELAAVTGDSALLADAAELVGAIEGRWEPSLRTWVDAGPFDRGSGSVRTLDASFALLVVQDPQQSEPAFADLVDPLAFGAEFGPAGVHRQEPSRDPQTYWRGPSWPQMSYLLWSAADSAGKPQVRDGIGQGLRAGVERSGWAEFWEPDTGFGLGAIPQSWSTVGILTV